MTQYATQSKPVSERTLKRKASQISKREAHSLVWEHEDLVLGASAKEIDEAITKVWKALRNLRFAKLAAEKANERN